MTRKIIHEIQISVSIKLLLEHRHVKVFLYALSTVAVTLHWQSSNCSRDCNVAGKAYDTDNLYRKVC